MKKTMRKKLLVLGTFAGVLLTISCAGGMKKTATYTSAEMEDAGCVMKYYDTSLIFLKNEVKERDINYVLSYMERLSDIPMFAYIMSPIMSKRDSMEVMYPGNCFSETTRQQLTRNFFELFSSKKLFYANFNKYLSLLKEKKTDGMADLLDDNYRLSLEMSECKQNIYDIMSPAATEAQQVLLFDNPQKEQIIAMKKMSLTIQSITDLYARRHADDKSRLDHKIAQLKLELNAAGKLPAAKKKDKQAEKLNDFLAKAGHFLTLVEDIRQKDTYTDEDYEEISSCGMNIM